jgi:hypothetical protein
VNKQETRKQTTDQHTIYELARLADVNDPDTSESPGGQWLRLVADATVEAVNYAEGLFDQDDAFELADSLVPIYTHQLWQVFVDLAAYQEDIDDLAEGTEDMTTRAGMALLMIAERVIMALVDENVQEDE